MSDVTSKPLSEKDFGQVLQKAANNNDGTIGTSGFAALKVGHKVYRDIVQTTPAIDDFYSLDIVKTQNITTTNLSAVVTGLTNAQVDLKVGQYVFSVNVPVLTQILSIDGPDQITLTAAATASGSVSTKFANLLIRLRVEYDDAARSNVDSVERLD